MNYTSAQLKALVKKRASGNSAKAQIIIRNYIMERFLERLSLSPYRGNLILKGGMLISSIVGLDTRSTLDVDATVKNFPLSIESAKQIVTEIAAISLDDGIAFQLKSAEPIMDEAEYGGIRVSLEAYLENMRTPLKLDISAGHVITPHEIDYRLKLMFETRTISILAYPLETVLAEKMECIISRGTANTRMRDFYDVYILQSSQLIDMKVFVKALTNTSRHRGTATVLREGALILGEVQASSDMQRLWSAYQRKFDYAREIPWADVMASIRTLYMGA